MGSARNVVESLTSRPGIREQNLPLADIQQRRPDSRPKLARVLGLIVRLTLQAAPEAFARVRVVVTPRWLSLTVVGQAGLQFCSGLSRLRCGLLDRIKRRRATLLEIAQGEDAGA